MINRRSRAATIALAGLAVAAFSSLGPGRAGAATAATPSLTATATFARATYLPGQKVSVTLTVKNTGASAAAGIFVRTDSAPTSLRLDQNTLGALGNGTTLAAGATITQTVTGNLQSLTANRVTFAGYVFDKQGEGITRFATKAAVAPRNASLSGEVFGDADANGKADAGEGVSGVKLTFSYAYGDKQYSVTTTSGGRFHLSLPTAAFYVDSSGTSWIVIPKLIHVPVAGAAPSLRAVKPLGHVLTAKMHFTKSSYKPGDTVHVSVTITNTGSALLHGIGAECDHAGDPNELLNNTTGWGALAAGSSGINLAAHQTRSFDVEAALPAKAQAAGQVAVECDFGYPEVYTGYRPDAYATAKVPGLSGAASLDVVYYPNGPSGKAVGLANVRAVFADPSTCPVLTKSATTDSKGHIAISGLPASPTYKLYVYPPKGWKVTYQNPTNALIIGKYTINLTVEVEHGTATVPPLPTCK